MAEGFLKGDPMRKDCMEGIKMLAQDRVEETRDEYIKEVAEVIQEGIDL